MLFRRAVNAADTIGESLAYRQGWLPDVDLDAALWDLARHLEIGTRLHHVLGGAPVGWSTASRSSGLALLWTGAWSICGPGRTV
ncbi:hypothetical protein ACLBYD_27780 [Rhodococcus sp. C26F]